MSPDELFAKYLDEKKHAEAVKGPVSIHDKVGAAFLVFGADKLRGKNLALVRDRMIVQSWSAKVWREEDLDSILTLTFHATRDRATIQTGGRRLALPEETKQLNTPC